jgi:hypothetical protein
MKGKIVFKQDHMPASTVTEMDEADLVFLDNEHTYDALRDELERFGTKSRRYIVMHDTQIYGENGQDGGPGLFSAMRDFVRKHKKWSVIYHTTLQYGLTVLGCQKQDVPKLPGNFEMATNLATAIAGHVADGMLKTTTVQFEARLNACSLCEQRVGKRCSACGCFVEQKAAMSSQDCPLAKWPSLEDDNKGEHQEMPILGPSRGTLPPTGSDDSKPRAILGGGK